MNKQKEWYKKPWGIVVAILLLPFFIIWYAWAKSKWSKGVKIGATVGAVLIMLIALGSSSPPPEETANNTSTSQTTNTEQVQQKQEPAEQKPPEPTKELTTQDKLWVAVDNSIKKREKIDIEYDATDKVVILTRTDESPYNAESFVRDTFTTLVLYGQEAFKVEGVDKVNIQNKTAFTDKYGKSSVDTGVIIEMSKDEFSKFDWKNLEYQEVATNIKASSSIYYIVPAIQSEIKDPSKLYLKLSY